MITMVATSDMHTEQDTFPVPGGDVLIVAGDWSKRGGDEESVLFLYWLKKQPHKLKLVVPGNHDHDVQDNPEEMRKAIERVGGILLVDEEVIWQGVKFYGTPWTLPYGVYSYMADEQSLVGKFGRVPDDTDVLIAHSPAYGFCDEQINYRTGHFTCSGSHSMLRTLERVKPKVFIHGHIHECGGKSDQLGKTRIYNVAMYGYSRGPQNPPTVITL